MKINNNYPSIKRKIDKMIILRKIFLLLYLIGTITCVVVNICVGGKMWSLYTIFGGLLVYVAVFDKPLVEHTFIKKSTVFMLSVCGYLYLINLIEHQNWYYFVISICLFEIIVMQGLIYLGLYRSQKRNLMPVFWTMIFSLVLVILAIVGVLKINWPIIALGSCGLFLLILFFTIFRKRTIAILARKFHTK